MLSGRRKYDHISDLLKQYEWLSAAQYVNYFDLCMLHKIIISGEPPLLSSRLVFNRDVVGRHTRQSDQLSLPRPRTNHGKRNYLYRSSSLFNSYFVSNSGSDILSVSTSVAKKRIRKLCAAPERDRRL